MGKPGRPPKAQIQPSSDFSEMFSEEELKALELAATEEFNSETKAAAAEAFKEETKRKLRQKAMFAAGKDAEGEDVESVTIDLAPHAPWITIDGRLYYHGVSYKFTRAQAATIKEVMYRTWAHEREVGGANVNAMSGRQPYNRVISQSTQ